MVVRSVLKVSRVVLLSLGLLATVSSPGVSAPVPAPSKWQPKPISISERKSQQREACIAMDLLQNYHYADRPFREIDSAEILNRHLEQLDPRRLIFLKSDIDFFRLRFSRTLKSVYLFRGDFLPAEEIFIQFVEKTQRRLEWVNQRLNQSFDFSEEDSAPAALASWAANPEEADIRWEKHLKSQVLQAVLSGLSQPQAVTDLRQHFDEWRDTLLAISQDAIREQFFENVLTIFDPHSGYSSATSARNFDQAMSGSTVGIGLRLQRRLGHFEVTHILPGSPADLQSHLRPGDIIDATAEGSVPLARIPSTQTIFPLKSGEAGSSIRLSYHTPGGPHREATLTREVIPLIDERVRGAIVQIPGNSTPARLGWIRIPSFYGSEEGPSLTEDTRALLAKMTAEPLDGLVLDLRHNPGGSLTECIRLCGLFAPAATIVLTRGLENTAEAHNAPNDPPAYAGPLILLTSNHSASASEVMSGAMQYHRRALIVGDDTTFGKGTVQAYIPLAKSAAQDAPNWGRLRLTSQRFTKPDGTAIQRVGVPSDIVLPATSLLPNPDGESQIPHALPAENVIPTQTPVPPPASVARLTPELLAHLRGQFESRASSLTELALHRSVLESEKSKGEAATMVSLQLPFRLNKQREQKASQHALLQRQLELKQTAPAYRTTRVDLDYANTIHKAHLDRIAQRLLHNPLRLAATNVESFLAGATTQPREIPLSRIPFSTPQNGPDEMGEVFRQASGVTISPQQLVDFLSAAQNLDEKTSYKLLEHAMTAFAPADASIVARGLDALLLHMVQTTPGLTDDPAAWDIPLRESLRLAADWAAYTSKTP